MRVRNYRDGASTFALLILSGVALSLPDDARAACAPAAGNNVTVNCTGTGNPAFDSRAFTGVTLNVAPGASVTGNVMTGGTGATSQFSTIVVGGNTTIANSGTIQLTPTVRDNYAINPLGSNITINNLGTITGTTVGSAPGAYRLYGVLASVPTTITGDFDNINVVNRGTISLTQGANPATGTAGNIARGIYFGENIDSASVDNFGTITATRTANVTATNADVAGIATDDDTDDLTIRNRKGATISAFGAGQTFAVGARAHDYTLVNDGTITASTAATGGTAQRAIVIYGGGGSDGANSVPVPGDSDITNSATGIINGNVSITDTSPFGTTLPTSTAVTRNSDFANAGTINGAFTYAAGAHTLDNTGTITGGITVNQQVGRNAAGALLTGIGAASFALTNEGTLGGNITISDRPDSVNSIALTGTGYAAAGAISTTGFGANSLSLSGVQSLGSVRNFSALDLETSNVTVANGVNLLANAQIGTTVFGPGGTTAAPTRNIGSIQGTLTLAGASTITPSFAGVARNGDVYTVATAVAAGGPVTVANRSALVTFTSSTTGGALRLQAAVRNANTVAGISTPGAQTINSFIGYGGTNAGAQAIGGAIENLGSDAQVAAAGRALSPTVNGADVQIPINATMLFHQQIDARLDNFLYGQIPVSGRSADLGVSKPVPVYGALPLNAAWIEGIGGGVHQSTLQGVTGYNADLTGVIGGYDRFILPNVRVGGAFGYINGEINGNANLNGSRETIQTYQGLVYGSYEGERTYARISAGYGAVDYRGTRQIAFAGFNGTATGSHNGNILTVRGEGGVPVETRAGLIVPYAAFTYGHLTQGGYAEQGGNGAGFAYSGATNDSERGEVGGKLIVPLGGLPTMAYLFPAGSIIAVEARGAYVHEFGNVAQNVTAGFVGGGNVFIVNGPNPSRDMVDYGVGLRMGTGPVQIDISYNGLAHSTYLQQVGLLRARYVF